MHQLGTTAPRIFEQYRNLIGFTIGEITRLRVLPQELGDHDHINMPTSVKQRRVSAARLRELLEDNSVGQFLRADHDQHRNFRSALKIDLLWRSPCDARTCVAAFTELLQAKINRLVVGHRHIRGPKILFPTWPKIRVQDHLAKPRNQQKRRMQQLLTITECTRAV